MADERSAATMIQEIEFAPDSPLEEAGFEPSVPGDGEVSWALSHSMSGGV